MFSPDFFFALHVCGVFGRWSKQGILISAQILAFLENIYLKKILLLSRAENTFFPVKTYQNIVADMNIKHMSCHKIV